MIIYKLTNKKTNKSYVGQTTNLNNRMYNHLRHVREGTNHPLYNSIKKYGIQEFEIQELERCDTKTELNKREIFWIQFFNTLYPNGYNIKLGGHEKQPDDLSLRIRKGLEHRKKPIIQFNPIDGVIISKFEGLADASRHLKIHKSAIGKCAKNFHKKTIHGFGFIYQEDFEKLQNKNLIIKGWKPIIGNRGKSVISIDDMGNEQVFMSIADAARIVGCDPRTISTVIKTGGKCKKLHWKYKD